VSEQLTFDLAPQEPPSFANFLPGSNAEAIAALKRCADATLAESVIELWGIDGAGKTHLARATVAMAQSLGRSAAFVSDPGMLSAHDPERLAAAHTLIAVDHVGAADASAQGRLFTLFNALAAQGGRLIAVGDAPPLLLSLREDLRTRLSWGLVYEIRPLSDADKPAALAAYAKRRGIRLPHDVIDYLLAHGRRDMGALLAALAALDKVSLATQRPITVPFVRDWLQRRMPL
jgi:DnaA family protein